MRVGQVLGKYQITEKVGTGRVTHVFKGTQAGLDREVAIKVLAPEHASDPSTLDRFRREGRATARLSHPNILTIYDSGEQDGHHYYVMEFLAPDDLRGRLDAGELSEGKAALRVATDVLKALDHCHQKGVAHGALGAHAVRFDLRGNAILTGLGDAEEAVPPGEDLHRFGAILAELMSGSDQEEADLQAVIERCVEAPAQAPETSSILKDLQRVERRWNIRQMSRQVEAPGYPSTTGAYKGSYSGFTGSFEGPSGNNALDSLIQSEGFVSLVQSLTGGYGDVTQRETQVRLAVVLGPFLLLAGLAALHLGGLLGHTPIRLLEQTKDPGSRTCELRWKADVACHSFIEYYSSPDRRHRTRPAAVTQTEFRIELGDLRPKTKYFYRFGFGHDPSGEAATYSSVYEFRTTPEVRIREVQVVDRKPDQVTIRWSTNLETNTKVRFGKLGGPTRMVENPDQSRELDHSITLHGLEGDVTYQYRVIAQDPDDPDHEVTSPEKRFITRPVLRDRRTPLIELARSYIDKLDRMTPDEKVKLERSLAEFLPTAENLTPGRLQELVRGRTTSGNFHERRLYLALWIESLARKGRDLPAGFSKPETTVLDEVEYLRSLFNVNPEVAASKLDRCMGLVAAATGLR
jgi:hypothetical protein